MFDYPRTVKEPRHMDKCGSVLRWRWAEHLCWQDVGGLWC